MDQERGGSVRGDRIRWARTQQHLTMRWVKEHGGPCPGYQSEVETRKKAEVRYEVLAAWLDALHVTEPFVRGAIARYTEDPRSCYGLAGDVGRLIATVGAAGTNWADLSPQERVRQVLRLILQRSTKLSRRAVLAWALGLEVDTLDAIMAGSLPVVKELMEAISALTTLQVEFFQTGTLHDYGPVVQRARTLGITPQELLQLLDRLGAEGAAPN